MPRPCAWTRSTFYEFYDLFRHRRTPTSPQPFVDLRLWHDDNIEEFRRAMAAYDEQAGDEQADDEPPPATCSARGEPMHGVDCGTPDQPLHYGCWQTRLDATTA